MYMYMDTHTCIHTFTHAHTLTHTHTHAHTHTHTHTHTQVYSLTLRAAGVPTQVVSDYKPFLSNMLGLVRGNIYYNLMNWYRCLSCIPVGDTAKYMETMMGVKQVRLSLLNTLLSVLDLAEEICLLYHTKKCLYMEIS